MGFNQVLWLWASGTHGLVWRAFASEVQKLRNNIVSKSTNCKFQDRKRTKREPVAKAACARSPCWQGLVRVSETLNPKP